MDEQIWKYIAELSTPGFFVTCLLYTSDPAAKLEEELIIRPTSETIIWSTYKNWINSVSYTHLKKYMCQMFLIWTKRLWR